MRHGALAGRRCHSRTSRCLTLAFAAATRTYWLEVWPFLRGETQRWVKRAAAIPDQTLRHIALDALHLKRGNLEGAVAFAALASSRHRLPSARAMAAYEAAFDYLDYLCEMPSDDPLANGRQLSQALIVAVQPGREHEDYFAHHPLEGDGGYLHALIEDCQSALGSLPARPAVEQELVRISSRLVNYQSLNHGDAHGSHSAFLAWASSEAAHRRNHDHGPELCWWEVGAAGGSSLAAFALFAAASDPRTGPAHAAAIDSAYFPWIGAVNSLLDSVVDRQEDNATGQHRLLDYYASPEQVAERLELITTHAMARARELQPRYGHALIVAAMTSFYLSNPATQAPDLYALRSSLRKSVGGLDAPTMLVMRARGAASGLVREKTTDSSKRFAGAGGGHRHDYLFPIVIGKSLAGKRPGKPKADEHEPAGQ
jgi:tetraprenyl-beta-curcumene synthase